MNRLPTELLGPIFDYALPHPSLADLWAGVAVSDPTIEDALYDQIATIRMVSHHWNDVALSIPSLWTTVLCHESTRQGPDDALHIFRLFMNRSGNLPIDVSVMLRDSPYADSSEKSSSAEMDPYAREVKNLLVANLHRVRSIGWEGRGSATIWPFHRPLPALRTMIISFHFSPRPIIPFDPLPALRHLQIHSASMMKWADIDGPQDVWENVDLTLIEELDVLMSPRNAVVDMLNRCPNVTALQIQGSSTVRAVPLLKPLKNLQRLKLESDMDWLPALVRPHASTLTHLSLTGQLVDLAIWVTFPVLPSLRTIEVSWEDGIEPLLSILNGAPNVQALSLSPRSAAQRIMPVLSYLANEPMLLFKTAASWGDDSEGAGSMTPSSARPSTLPNLRLLRLCFGSIYHRRDGVLPTTPSPIHRTTASKVPQVLALRNQSLTTMPKSEPFFRVELLLPASVMDVAQVWYSQSVAEFPSAIYFRTMSMDDSETNSSSSFELADSYRIFSNTHSSG